MKIEHIYPPEAGTEQERKEKIQAAYTDLQKMFNHGKKDKGAAAKRKKGREEHV